MKSKSYQRRFYQDNLKAKNLHLLRYQLKETDLYILCDQKLEEKFIARQVYILRSGIESYIRKDPRFEYALKPLTVELRAAKVVRLMSCAGNLANVGPMAASAGAIAELLGKTLLKKGCKEVIIENGGDIFLKITSPRKVALYSGRGTLANQLVLLIRPQDTPLGICTSSATIGHSLSFGRADSVTVLAKSAAVADALATATCNRVNALKEMESALNFCCSHKGVSGCLIVMKNKLAALGKIEFSRRR
jgi:hypothetical protein